MLESRELLFIATTDSYVKWVNGLRRTLSPEWSSSMFMTKTLQNPSPRQTRVAVGSDEAMLIQSRHILSVIRWIRKHRPAAVIVGATGPFLVLLRWLLSFTSYGRGVKLVSGSPGVAYHLIGAPLRARTAADLILVASLREWKRLRQELANFGSSTQLALATLPFLQSITSVDRFDGAQALVFAPQPDMPKDKEDREYLLLELGKLVKESSDLEIRIKLRATAKEPQTHFEEHSYPKLEQELVKSGRLRPNSFNFVLGSIAEQLRNQNAALITLSSTAALESLALGNPTHIISDFGSRDEIATSVFADSGIVWPIRDHAIARLQKPTPEWMDENYFHNREFDDWQQALATLAEAPTKRNFEVLPSGLKKSMFAGEFLRVMLPNPAGKFLIWLLKSLLGKKA